MTVLDLAHFTDVHLGPLPQARLGELMGKRALGFLSWHHRRHRLHTRGVLDCLVDDLQADPPDHVAITGDLVNIALPSEFELAARWLESLGPAEWVSLVPGNHDAYAGRHLQRSWSRWHAWMRGDEPDSSGRFPFVRRLHDRLALIGLSSAVPSPVGQATGTVGPAQLEALDGVLEGLGREGVCRILLLHHPPLGSMIRRRRALRDEAGLRKVIARRGAELVLSGHEHFFLFGGMPGKDAPVPVFVGPSASLAHGPLRTGGYLRHAIDLSGNAPRFTVQLRHCEPGTGAIAVAQTARVECTGSGLELAPADWPKGRGSATESFPDTQPLTQPMLGTLDRYVLGQVLRPMLAAILITLLALLAERALRVVDLVIGWRGSLAIVFEMLSYLVPHYMVVALPAAFFLGIMLAIGRLSREGELDAMRAAGIGLARIARPLVLLATGVMVLHFILVSHLQPFSRYAYRAAAFAVTNASFQTLLRPQQFITLGRNTYRVEALEAEGERFAGIFLYSEANEAGSVTVTAAAGEIESRGALVPLVLHLQNGVQQFVPRPMDQTEASGNPPPPLTLRFGSFTSDLSGTEPEPFRPRGENERELTIPELFDLLWAPAETLPEEIDPWEIEAELSARLVRNLTILVLPFFALPMALSPRRAKRSYGLLVGIVLLVGYNQLVNTGEALADDAKLSHWLSLWLPFLCFVTLSVGYFVRTARRVPDPGRSSLLGATIDGLVGTFLRRLPWRAA